MIKRKSKTIIASLLSLAMVTTLSVPFSGTKAVKAEENEPSWTRYITKTDGTTFGIYDNGSVRDDLNSQDLVDNEMGLGINLGNTFEATILAGEKEGKSGYDYEKNWGQPVTTRNYINKLHEFGFNTIRIPVGWSNGDIDDGNYKIRTELFDRVEEVANYALDNGMYVIINDHWDNQWWGQFGAAKYEEDGETKVPDEEMRAEAWKRYEAYWTQISERFKDYSDHLIFEGANEELCERLNDPIVKEGIYKGYCLPSNASMTDNPVISGCMKIDELYETVNKINQLFVDTVRKTGGNNEKRFLMIPGYGTDIASTADLPPASTSDDDTSNEEDKVNEGSDDEEEEVAKYERYVMPTDPIEGNGKKKLILSVHYYTPTSFCLNASGIYTKADQEANHKWFADLQKFADEGYGIVLGECGVCEPASAEGSVTQWYHDIFELAQKYHACPVIWDTGANFNRTKAEINFKDLAILFNTVNGTNATYTTDTLTGGAGGNGGDTSKYMPDYLDDSLWDKNENGNKIRAYCYYQTSSWDYRNLYTPLRKLSEGQYTWNYIQALGSEVTKETSTVEDVQLTKDGSYKIKIDGIDLSGALKFKMLGISTDILVSKYPGITVDNVNVYFDGELYSPKKDGPPYDLSTCIKDDEKYYTFTLINEYAGDIEKLQLPLGKVNNKGNLNLPKKSIEITFDIHGLADVLKDIEDGTYVNPEAIPEDEEPDPSSEHITEILEEKDITVRFKWDDTSNVPAGRVIPTDPVESEEPSTVPTESSVTEAPSTAPTDSSITPVPSTVPTDSSVTETPETTTVKSFTSGKFKYKVTKQAGKSAGTVTMTSLTKSGLKAKTLKLPLTVKKNNKTYKVTKIGAKSFKNAKAKHIILNKNITAIPKLAFNKCKKLSILTLNKKLKSVKKNAFKGCKKKIKVKGKQVKANKKKLKKTAYKKFK